MSTQHWLYKSAHVNQVLPCGGAICWTWIIQVSAVPSMIMLRQMVFSMIIGQIVMALLQFINKLVLCLSAFEPVEAHVHWFCGFGRHVFGDDAMCWWVVGGNHSFWFCMPHFSNCDLEGHSLFVQPVPLPQPKQPCVWWWKTGWGWDHYWWYVCCWSKSNIPFLWSFCQIQINMMHLNALWWSYHWLVTKWWHSGELQHSPKVGGMQRGHFLFHGSAMPQLSCELLPWWDQQPWNNIRGCPQQLTGRETCQLGLFAHWCHIWWVHFNEKHAVGVIAGHAGSSAMFWQCSLALIDPLIYASNRTWMTPHKKLLSPVDGNFIMIGECVDEVLSTLFSLILNTKIIHYWTKVIGCQTCCHNLGVNWH